MTGPFTCGFGRYGIVAPLGGDCEREERGKKINYYFCKKTRKRKRQRQVVDVDALARRWNNNRTSTRMSVTVKGVAIVESGD
jgi:hypothetical protein